MVEICMGLHSTTSSGKCFTQCCITNFPDRTEDDALWEDGGGINGPSASDDDERDDERM